MLQEHRKAQLLERIRACKKYQNHELVFCNALGQPLHFNNVRRRHYRPVITEAELNPALTLYSLRHSFATLSLAVGVDAKKVSCDLGHESVAFTLDTYVHMVEKMRLNAAGKLASILFPKSAGKI